MKFKSCTWVVSLMLISSSICAELQLEKGTSINDQNIMSLASTSLPYAASFCGWNNPCPVNTSAPLAFVQADSQGNYYALKQDLRLVSFNVNTKVFDLGWPLNAYPDLTIMSGELPQGAKTWHEEGVYQSPYWTVTDPSSPQTGKDIIHREGHIKPAKTHGCFDLQPLRYGDINQDGQAEIIVMKDGNMSISSTTKRAEIFNANWFMNDDIVINNDPGTVIPEPTPEQLAAIPENAPQFGAYSNLLKYMEDQNLPAWRSFAKLYFGEFDGDSAHDILMWRKLYESRLMSDPVKGFYKKGELYIHYKLIDGVYKKQLTESSVIQGWLTAKNLTWQKGYPSKSECPGQTDQLIPEMHDPLLNDPDVLQ